MRVRSFTIIPLLVAGLLTGCPDSSGDHDGDGSGGAASAASRHERIVVTVHFRGGNEQQIRALETNIETFGTVVDAKVDPVTRRAWVLMKDGVTRSWAEVEREMLKAKFRPPIEYVASTWAYNEGDWFGQIQ